MSESKWHVVYVVYEAASADELAAMVNVALVDGWELAGGVCARTYIVEHRGRENYKELAHRYTQALFRVQPEAA